MAILTTSGRTALAIAVKAQALHLAWGTGSAAWDTTPIAEPVGASALIAEVGRRAFNTVQYCTPDDAGSLIVPTGRYAPSASPTNNLYVYVDFDYADGANASIREIGVFLGTIVKNTVPPGQVYFQPADLQAAGTLLALQYVPKITRSGAVRQSFEFVIEL